MATEEITAQTFEDTITNNDIVIVDFWRLGVDLAVHLHPFMKKYQIITLILSLPK